MGGVLLGPQRMYRRKKLKSPRLSCRLSAQQPAKQRKSVKCPKNSVFWDSGSSPQSHLDFGLENDELQAVAVSTS